MLIETVSFCPGSVHSESLIRKWKTTSLYRNMMISRSVLHMEIHSTTCRGGTMIRGTRPKNSFDLSSGVTGDCLFVCLFSAWVNSIQSSPSGEKPRIFPVPHTQDLHIHVLCSAGGPLHPRLESPGRWRCVELLLLCSLICFQAAHATEPDDPNAMLSRTLSSRFWDMSYLVSCTAFIDWTAPSVCYLCLAAVQLYMDESNSQTLVPPGNSEERISFVFFCGDSVVDVPFNSLTCKGTPFFLNSEHALPRRHAIHFHLTSSFVFFSTDPAEQLPQLDVFR